MSSDFDSAANLVLKQEGGYDNNPSDPGGETKYGISKRSYPDLDIPNLTEGVAKGIYFNDFWQDEWSDLPQNVANLLLSLSVNIGKTRTISIAQKSVGTVVDGVWGHLTQSTVLATPDAPVEIAVRAIKFYASLNQPQFITGWIRRVLEALCG